MSESMTARLSLRREEAVYAMENGDYQTAYNKLLAAQVIYDTSPNTEKDGLRIEWRSIERLMQRIEKLISQSQGNMGLQRVPVKFKRPENE